MSIEKLFFVAMLGGLLLPLSASADVVKTMTCQPGHTLKVAGTKVWCQGSSTVWKPGPAPNCGSGKQVDVRAGVDKCKTPVTSKKPTCSAGHTYITKEGADKCRTPPVGRAPTLVATKCFFPVAGVGVQPGIYKVRSGVDACQKAGGGKISSLPSNACQTATTLRTDMTGQADKCAIKTTQTVKSAVILR